MRSLNLDVAGEYLLMAATLAHLKSRELVPPDPAEDAALAAEEEADELDPRQELIRRLLEYQKFKDAGDKLAGRPVTGRNVWPRGASAEDVAGLHALPGGAPLAEVPVFRLIESLERVLSRAKVTFTHDVITDRISITDKINELADRLERDGSFSFESCFAFVEEGAPTTPLALKGQVVVTFLAILEMTRLKMVRLTQADVQSPIYITKAGADLKVQAEALRADPANPDRPEEYKE
jgi:segregation and condensation protein A